MSISEIHSYLGVIVTIFGLLYVFAKFKAEFEQHKKILSRHEYAINAIVVRLEAMNAETNFMKGFLVGKQ